MLVVTENGYGKRSEVEEYRVTNRGGKGVKAMNITQKTGLLAALLMVRPDEDIMIITDDGTIIRTPAEDIRETGRNAQGVRLMRVAEGSKIVDVARAEREIEEDEDTVTELPDNGNNEAANDNTEDAERGI